MASFLDLLTDVPSILYNLSGGSNPYQSQQEELAKRQGQIGAALTDTNNPLYQKLYGQYQNQGAQNAAQGIAEAQAQNRLATKMGRTPLFANGREGEALFRQLMGAYQNLGTQADTQTRAALTGAVAPTAYGQKSYENMTPQAALSGYQQNVMTPSGIGTLLKGQTDSSGGIGDLLKKLLSNQQSQQQTQHVMAPGQFAPQTNQFGLNYGVSPQQANNYFGGY